MKTLLPLTALLLASLAVAGGVTAPKVAPIPTFRAVTCPADVKASKCGFVKVPLDHAQPGGPQIELFVAVQGVSDKVPVDKKAADPLFYLEGGPGGPSAPSVGPLGQAFQNREVVGIDQRGVGRSLPSLNCAPLTALMNRVDLETADVLPLFQKAMTQCAADLRGKGVKLEYFNTAQAALDVDTVRRALGYSQINLYGASYGTRLAQEVMRRAPEGLRAVVLDSVIPVTVDRVARTPLALQEGLQRVFAACKADQGCDTKYPDLERTYRDVLKKLDTQPLKLNAQKMNSNLDAVAMQGIVFNSMYFPDGIAQIPGLIVAARDGDTKTIEGSFAVKLLEALADSLTWPAFFTNECMGEVAYSSPAALEKGLKAAPEFAGVLRSSPSISSPSVFGVCKSLGLTAPTPLENAGLNSDVPTLLLAGEFDPVTPVNWLREAQAGLSKGQSLVIKGASHGSGLTSECGFLTVFTFLQDPSKQVAPPCAGTGKLTFK